MKDNNEGKLDNYINNHPFDYFNAKRCYLMCNFLMNPLMYVFWLADYFLHTSMLLSVSGENTRTHIHT